MGAKVTVTMGCQSSKAAVREQTPEGKKPSAGSTLLTTGSQSPAKNLGETTPTAVIAPALDATHSNSAVSMGSSRSGGLRKQSTVSLKREDVDVLVTKFTCSSKMS